MIMLSVHIYTTTSSGLRSVVSILKSFEKTLGEPFGRTPCYNTVANWMRKLGLSIYEEDTPKNQKYGVMVDESITINKEKLLMILGFAPDHKGKPLGHEDVVVLGMKVGESFKRGDIKNELESLGVEIDYGVSDGAHNLAGGFRDSGIVQHLDISHTLGNCMKHIYEKDPEFVELTTTLGKIRLQYHLTDKAWLLPPNMRAIARFMNLRTWVDWAYKLIKCYDTLDERMKEAYAFILKYKDLVEELMICTDAISHVEQICKCQGFGLRTNALCRDYIIRNVIGNANNRRASVGLGMIDYFNRQADALADRKAIHHISSDIIESCFGIFKNKKSPNNLYGVTSLVLILPLYPNIVEYSVEKEQDFKERLAKVKLKDIDLWAKENLSENRVMLRSKTLNKAG